jgi:hypothetical protein
VPDRYEKDGMTDRPIVRIEPWGEGDGSLLEQLLGDPEMTTHIGGPETAEKLEERQTRYQVPGSAAVQDPRR